MWEIIELYTRSTITPKRLTWRSFDTAEMSTDEAEGALADVETC